MCQPALPQCEHEWVDSPVLGEKKLLQRCSSCGEIREKPSESWLETAEDGTGDYDDDDPTSDGGGDEPIDIADDYGGSDND